MMFGLLPMALLAAAPAAPAPSVFSDDLSKCLVTKASGEDKTLLIRWIFSAMASNASVSKMADVSDAEKHSISVATGGLIQRLLTVDCHAEAVAALKADGAVVIETSFELLGKVAMREIMTDPAVASQLAAIQEGADQSKMTALFTEAGLATAK